MTPEIYDKILFGLNLRPNLSWCLIALITYMKIKGNVFGQREMAAHFGVDSLRINRAIKKLEKLGFVELGYVYRKTKLQYFVNWEMINAGDIKS